MKSSHEEIKYTLGKIVGKLDGITERLEKINGRLDDHTKRIRTNETGLAVIKTKAGIIGGIAGFAIIAVWEYLKSQFK